MGWWTRVRSSCSSVSFWFKLTACLDAAPLFGCPQLIAMPYGPYAEVTTVRPRLSECSKAMSTMLRYGRTARRFQLDIGPNGWTRVSDVCVAIGASDLWVHQVVDRSFDRHNRPRFEIQLFRGKSASGLR